MRVAAKLFELASALSRARDRDDLRLPLVHHLGRSLEEIGELGRADQLLDEVKDDAGAPPSRLAYLEVVSLRDYTQASTDSFEKLKAAAGRVRDSDPEVEARASILEAEVLWTEGAYGEMEELLRKTLETVGDLDDPDPEKQALRNSILAWEARAILLGPKMAGEGRDRCDVIRDEAHSRTAHALEASVLGVSAGLHAMLDEFDEARECYKESRRIGEAFGLTAWLAALSLYSGPVEILAGKPEDAARQLRRGLAALKRMGDKSRAATTAAFLAHALYEAGDLDDAKESAERSEDLAATEDVFTQVVWRGALAKVRARKGNCDGALGLAREAMDLAGNISSPNLKGDALFDLAKVLKECDPPKAHDAAGQARDEYDQKGNLAGVRRVNEFLEGLPK